MSSHLVNLLSASWRLFLHWMGTTGLGFFTPILVFVLSIVITLLVIAANRGKDAMRQHWKETAALSVGVTLAVMLLIYGPIFVYSLVVNVYTDHQALVDRVKTLRQERDAAVSKLNNPPKREIGAYFDCDPRSFYVTDPFPADKPLMYSVSCRNVGAAPAFDPQPMGKIILRPDGNEPTQKKLINDWKSEVLDLVKKNATGGERPPIFPNEPTLWTAHGAVLSNDQRAKLYSSSINVAVFLIGAIRFRDNTGEHEAHICKVIVSIQGVAPNASPFPAVSRFDWADCMDYLTQVDIHEN
jgi:hypothetical protein